MSQFLKCTKCFRSECGRIGRTASNRSVSETDLWIYWEISEFESIKFSDLKLNHISACNEESLKYKTRGRLEGSAETLVKAVANFTKWHWQCVIVVCMDDASGKHILLDYNRNCVNSGIWRTED